MRQKRIDIREKNFTLKFFHEEEKTPKNRRPGKNPRRLPFFIADSESTPQITYLTSIRKNLKRVLLRKVHLNVNAAVITRARTLQVRIPSHAKLFCPPPFVFLNHSEMFARCRNFKKHYFIRME